MAQFIGLVTLNAENFDSESATDGQVLTADGAGGAAWEDAAGGGGGGVDVQVFSTPGTDTWTKPSGAKMVQVIIIGGGTGGQGGSYQADGEVSIPVGGYGGEGGYRNTEFFMADLLPATVDIVVGAGGAGGAGATAQLTPGDYGTSGLASTFGAYSNVLHHTSLQSGYGGAGGSDNNSGSNAPSVEFSGAFSPGITAGLGGTAPGGAGANGLLASLTQGFYIGLGGGGGASGQGTDPGGAGGNGIYGGGGGGGGGAQCTEGLPGGAGGNGGDGLVVVVSW